MAHDPPWRDSTALFSVPWGKRHQIPSQPYLVSSYIKKPSQDLTSKICLWSCLGPCVFVKCHGFLCTMFLVSPSLCLTCCYHLRGYNNKGDVAYRIAFIAGNCHHRPVNHSSPCFPFALCPTLPLISPFHRLHPFTSHPSCPLFFRFPSLVSGIHLSWLLSKYFPQQSNSSLRQICLSHSHVLTILSSLYSQRVSRRPN